MSLRSSDGECVSEGGGNSSLTGESRRVSKSLDRHAGESPPPT